MGSVVRARPKLLWRPLIIPILYQFGSESCEGIVSVRMRYLSSAILAFGVTRPNFATDCSLMVMTAFSTNPPHTLSGLRCVLIRLLRIFFIVPLNQKMRIVSGEIVLRCGSLRHYPHSTIPIYFPLRNPGGWMSGILCCHRIFQQGRTSWPRFSVVSVRVRKHPLPPRIPESRRR